MIHYLTYKCFSAKLYRIYVTYYADFHEIWDNNDHELLQRPRKLCWTKGHRRCCPLHKK